MKKIKENIIYILIFLLFFIIYLIPIKENKPAEQVNYIRNPHFKAEKNKLRVAVEKTANPLNPFDDNSNNVSMLSKLINSSLISKDKNNNINLDIAKEYWYENEGKTIAVVLKNNLKFSSGETITTEHVKNTYKILAHPNYNGIHKDYVENIQGFYRYKMGKDHDFTGIEVLGNYFIKFHFNKADFSNISFLTFPIMNITQDVLDKINSETLKNFNFTHGSGRFKVDNYNEEKISLSLRDDIDKEELKNIKVKNIDIYILDYNKALNKYASGSLDILYKYNKTQKLNELYTDRIKEYSYNIDNESNIYKYIGFNEKSKFFKNVLYRQALRDSINFEEIIKENYGNTIYSFINIPIYKNSWFNNEKININKRVNLTEILQKNFEKKANFFIDKDQEELTIKMIAQDDNEFVNNISKGLIKKFQEKGIKLEIIKLKPLEMIEALKKGGDYDLYLSQRYMTELPRSLDEDLFKHKSRFTITSEIDYSFSYLLDKIKENINDEKIQYMTSEWKNMFVETVPYIVLAVENKISIINNRIKGIYLNEFVGLDNINNLINIDFRD